MKRLWIRAALGLAVVVATTLAFAAAPAQAGLIGTGPAAYCDPDPTQIFAPWGDNAYYSRVPGGSFEAGEPAWSMLGGARIVSGNEPFQVGGAGDRRSLLIAGGTAMSPPACFALGDWHARFFVRNVGSRHGKLHVAIVVPSILGGLLSVLDGGIVSADGTWQPSTRVSLLLSNVSSLVGTRAVAFRFTTLGWGAAYQIDDVYLDPWKTG